MTLSTKCLREELRSVPSHWASSYRYMCVGCEREQCIRVWALVFARNPVWLGTDMFIYDWTSLARI